MPLILGTNSIKDTGFNVANSLRFNSGSSDSLSQTQSSGETKTFTYSCWFKKNRDLGSTDQDAIFTVGENNTNDFLIYFQQAEDIIDIIVRDSSTIRGRLTTNRKFRDYSAWMHIVFVYDSTNATAGNRMRLYINGIEETSFSSDTNPSLNQTTVVNNSSYTMRIGRLRTDARYLSGYLSECVLIDGTALDPTSFGEFDEDSGIWKPINVSGLTFGTNGFYLDFENSGSLGADVSGNGNNFTVNNLTAIDQTTDTCTNNFCTLNPLTISGATLSEGNLKYTHTQNGEYRTVLGTFGLNSGKWYWEVKIVSEDGFRPVSGIASTEDLPYYQPAYNTQHLGKGNASAGLFTHGDMQLNGSSGSPTPATLDDGDITGFALDLDSGTNTLAVYKNGTLDQTYNLTTVGTYGSYTPAITGYHSANNVMEINFGNPSFSISSGNSDANGYGNFEYAVPSGFFSLCTKNLAEYG